MQDKYLKCINLVRMAESLIHILVISLVKCNDPQEADHLLL